MQPDIYYLLHTWLQAFSRTLLHVLSRWVSLVTQASVYRMLVNLAYMHGVSPRDQNHTSFGLSMTNLEKNSSFHCWPLIEINLFFDGIVACLSLVDSRLDCIWLVHYMLLVLLQTQCLHFLSNTGNDGRIHTDPFGHTNT